MTEHYLKCWPAYFDAIESGNKNFEVRRDDRGFQRGDVLVLEKFDPHEKRYFLDGTSRASKPIRVRRRITYILTGGQFGIQTGYVIMGLQFEPPADAPG